MLTSACFLLIVSAKLCLLLTVHILWRLVCCLHNLSLDPFSPDLCFSFLHPTNYFHVDLGACYEAFCQTVVLLGLHQLLNRGCCDMQPDMSELFSSSLAFLFVRFSFFSTLSGILTFNFPIRLWPKRCDSPVLDSETLKVLLKFINSKMCTIITCNCIRQSMNSKNSIKVFNCCLTVFFVTRSISTYLL